MPAKENDPSYWETSDEDDLKHPYGRLAPRYYGDEDDQRWEAERLERDEALHRAEQARLALEDGDDETERPEPSEQGVEVREGEPADSRSAVVDERPVAPLDAGERPDSSTPQVDR